MPYFLSPRHTLARSLALLLLAMLLPVAFAPVTCAAEEKQPAAAEPANDAQDETAEETEKSKTGPARLNFSGGMFLEIAAVGNAKTGEGWAADGRELDSKFPRNPEPGESGIWFQLKARLPGSCEQRITVDGDEMVVPLGMTVQATVGDTPEEQAKSWAPVNSGASLPAWFDAARKTTDVTVELRPPGWETIASFPGYGGFRNGITIDRPRLSGPHDAHTWHMTAKLPFAVTSGDEEVRLVGSTYDHRLMLSTQRSIAPAEGGSVLRANLLHKTEYAFEVHVQRRLPAVKIVFHNVAVQPGPPTKITAERIGPDGARTGLDLSETHSLSELFGLSRRFSAKLPNAAGKAATVSLIGLTAGPEGKDWWAADGGPAFPDAEAMFFRNRSSDEEDQRRLEVVLRTAVEHAAGDEAMVNPSVRFADSDGTAIHPPSSEPVPQQNGEDPPRVRTTFAAHCLIREHGSNDKIHVEAEIAYEPWQEVQDLTLSEPPADYESFFSWKPETPDQPYLFISRESDTGKRPRLTLTAAYAEEPGHQYQLALFDTQGEAARSSSSARGSGRLTMTFLDVTEEQIGRVVLQRRPMYRVRFQDVSIWPGIPSAASVIGPESESPVAAGDAEADPAMVLKQPDGTLATNPQSDAAIAAVKRLEQLGALLHFEGKGESVDGQALPRLTGVELRDVADEDLALLRVIAGLDRLDVNSEKTTDAGIRHLESLASLKTLRIEQNRKVTTAALRSIGRLTKLRTLEIGDSLEPGDAGYSAEDFAALESLTELKELELTNWRINDRVLELLAPLKKLEKLAAFGEQVTDAGLQHVANLRAMKYLILHGTNATDAGIALFEDHRNIGWLGVTSPQITDAAISSMLLMPELYYLDLPGSQVTDAGIDLLFDKSARVRVQSILADQRKLPTLRILNLFGTRVSGERIAQLQAEHPKLQIRHNEPKPASPKVLPLSFRLVPTQSLEEGQPWVSKGMEAALRQEFQKQGPNAAYSRGQPVAWFEMANDDQGLPIVEEREGKKWGLLARQTATPERDPLEIEMVRQGIDTNGQPVVNIKLSRRSGEMFSTLTEKNLQRQLAVLIENRVLIAPIIRSKIGAELTITGRFDEAEVKGFVAALQRAVKADPAQKREPVEPTSKSPAKPPTNPPAEKQPAEKQPAEQPAAAGDGQAMILDSKPDPEEQGSNPPAAPLDVPLPKEKHTWLKDVPERGVRVRLDDRHWVEVLSLSTFGKDPVQWTPAGQLINPPAGFDPVSLVPADGDELNNREVNRSVTLRAVVPKGEHMTLSGVAFGSPELSRTAINEHFDQLPMQCSIDGLSTAKDLKVGIADSEWKTAVSRPVAEFSVANNVWRKENQLFVLSPGDDRPGGVEEKQTRITVRTTDGQERELSPSWRQLARWADDPQVKARGEQDRSLQLLMIRLPETLGEIASVKVDVRSYRWVTFENLSIYPGPLTEIRTRIDGRLVGLSLPQPPKPLIEKALREAASSARTPEAAGKEQAPAEAIPLKGRVVDENGQPLLGMWVGLFAENEDFAGSVAERYRLIDSATSDLSGNYSLEAAKEKDWFQGVVWAVGPNRESGFRPYYAVWSSVTKDLKITVRKAKATVRVLSPEEQPLAGVMVRPESIMIPRSVGYQVPAAVADRLQARTDDEGRYQLPSYEAGSIRGIAVVSEEYGTQYLPSKYASQWVEGDQPLPLKLQPVGSLNGTVRKRNLDPEQRITPFQVVVTTENWDRDRRFPPLHGRAVVTPDSDGSYRIPQLAIGRTQAETTLPSGSLIKGRFSDPVVLQAGEGATLDLELLRGVVVAQRLIKQATGEGIPNVELKVLWGDAVHGGGSWAESVDCVTDSDGWYAAAVLPGPINVRIRSGVQEFENAVWFNGRIGYLGAEEIVHADLQSQTLPPIEYLPMQTMTGRLLHHDGKPAIDWMIYGHPVAWNDVGVGGVETNAQGEFTWTYPEGYPPRLFEASNRIWQTKYDFEDQKIRPTVESRDPLILRLPAPQVAAVGGP